MILLLHVLIALTSIVLAIYTYFYPTKKHMHVSYVFIGLTLISGTYLILETQTSILHSCITGLAYLVVAVGATVMAKRRLVINQTH